jgi:two-component system chemotaxis response regulator CheB
MRKIKVLIVDDSALVRQSLQEIIESSDEMELVGAAGDPYIAAKYIQSEVPDVITLDIEMPKMDGLTFLQKLMSQHPIPVVMCSTLTSKNSEAALKAIEYGAVDIIEKPKFGTKQFFEESKVLILDALKAAALAKPKNYVPKYTVDPKYTADVIMQKTNYHTDIKTKKIIVVGASTGGTEAIKDFLEPMPANAPGIVIVQHMPEQFTASFAKRLDSFCKMKVVEAVDGDKVEQGKVIIGKGNSHLLLKRRGEEYYVELKEGPLVSRHRPSVDVLFRSAARYAGKNAVGVIMTGMGDDGAKGLKELRDEGAYTIAQNEETCVVFGMPHEAIKLGAACKILPLPVIYAAALKYASV